jgi:para-nitrobenzyl esterase
MVEPPEARRRTGRFGRFAVLAAAAAASMVAGAVVRAAPAQPPVARAAAQSAGVPVVVTDRGAVGGTSAHGMRGFLGIPYAQAPVGDLRWRPPRPRPAWTGVRNATAFGSSCPQTASLLWRQSTNEDCLFLNVFAPTAVSAGGYPVMVWIHGGGLVSGESDDYLPRGLVAHNVVVVTVNYRLGALGFLSHPALSAGSPIHASGNYGLLDQQFALRWVQRNIGRFGGDPRNVTLFGESSGGQSVHEQLASPTARGLFQRAIVQSGGYAGRQPTLRMAEAAGSAFAAAVGCRAQTAACLRRTPVATLLANQPSLAVTPVLDGHTLTQSLAQAFTSGRFNRVPVIEGSNHDEDRFFLATNGPAGTAPLAASGYPAAIGAALGVGPSAVAAITTHYPLRSYPSASVALGAVLTDAFFACPAQAATTALSRYTPTYQYEFDDEYAPRFFPTPPLSFPLGAFHTAELQYLFTLRGHPSHLTADQETLASAMLNLWTTFARTGNPGSGWPRYSNTTAQTESLEPPQPVATTSFPTDHRCAFWNHRP